MRDILLILLGATLSYLATILAEKQKFKSIRREEKMAYALRARLSLQSLNGALERLKDGYSYRNFFEFQKLDMIDNQIADLQFLKADIEKLSPEKQEKLLILLSDITLLAKEMRGLENFSVSSREDIKKSGKLFSTIEEHDGYFEKQRTQKLIDLVEIKRRIDDFIRGVL